LSYSTAEARQQILDDLAVAIQELAVALACLGEAYELLDQRLADTLEEQLFAPTQSSYGLARRTHAEFAARHGLTAAAPGQASSGLHDSDPRTYVRRALDAAERADLLIGELQDSMLPVEVGDRELRDGLSRTRELIGQVPHRAGELLRTIGR